MMTAVTGTIYRATNVREKVTYAYVETEDGKKVDVVAFPGTQANICAYLATLNVGDEISVSGRIAENDKSKYALQLIAENIITTDVEIVNDDEYKDDDIVWVSGPANKKVEKRFGDLSKADQTFLRNWVCPAL